MGFYRGPKIVTNGLVLYLDAANKKSYPGTGTTWTDLSGFGNNGTLTNGPTFNSANNGSIVFDGTNDYVLLNRPQQIITSGSLSICLWAKWTTIGTTTSTIQALVDNNHVSGINQQGFVIQDRPDLNKRLSWSVNPNTNPPALSIGQAGDGNWKHITGTHVAGSSRLYINGLLEGSVSDPNMSSVQPNISIGYWQFSTSRFLNGMISSVKIYNRALSANEVLQNYNATKGRFNL